MSVRFPPIADLRISGDAAAMNRFGVLAYGVAVTIIALLTAREAGENLHAVYLYRELTGDMVALGLVGWSISTIGPLALSVWFWRLARRADPPWVWHLLFIPCGIAIYRAGASILFFSADVPDGDSIEGGTLIADSFLLLTLLIHAAALAALGEGSVVERMSANHPLRTSV